MTTIKLRVSDKIKDKFLKLIGQFSNEELEVLESGDAFETNRKYVAHEHARLESGKSRSYSVEEADAILEETIRKYER